jgi:uncharacterized protein (DUF58 family)
MAESDGISQLLSAATSRGSAGCTSVPASPWRVHRRPHRSQLKGVSVEFADYRQYVAGDDPKHIDWRVFGRNERLYLRQYEEETSLRVHLIVDGSNSMSYAHGKVSKYRFAASCAAALAYITVHQQDAVGLRSSMKAAAGHPAPRRRRAAALICRQLAQHQPAAKPTWPRPCITSRTGQTPWRRHHLQRSLRRLRQLKAALAHFRRRAMT